MVYTGKDIRNSKSETLQPMPLDELLRRIEAQEGELAAFTGRLRKVRALDETAYRGLKTNLPFFMMAEFRQGLRNGEHFQQIQGFCIDIDSLDPVGQDAHELLKARLIQDEHALAVFTTPSGCGLKVLFQLHQPCDSSGLFTGFYRAFAKDFAVRYGLMGKVDMKNCDVTRVHFYCSDPGILRNPLFRAIHIEEWLNQNREESDLFQSTDMNREAEPETREIDYASIMEKLGGGAPKKAAKTYFVPDVLYAAEPRIRACIEMVSGMEIKELRPIQYGLKFIVMHHGNEGEVNVFSGRKGFSVVQSPRGGTHAGLNKLLQGLIEKALYMPQYSQGYEADQ